MSAISPEELPLPQRIALSYAPRSVRGRWLTLLLFDVRLSSFVAQASEPLLGQMRLAWWRDTLATPHAQRPKGNPLLHALSREFADRDGELIALVDGWENLLASSPLPENAIEGFLEGRCKAVTAIASAKGGKLRLGDLQSATQRWSLADLLVHTSDAGERETLQRRAQTVPRLQARLPRAMRPLAILEALAKRSLDRGGTPLLGDRASALLAIRVGLFGR